MKLLDAVLAGIEAVRHQRRIEQVSFWESVDTHIGSGPGRPERSMTAQEIAAFIKQHVRVRSFVRVWKSWVRLVECDLEMTIPQGAKPEKHSLRIVEYNSGQYYEEDEQLLWNHYSAIFLTFRARISFKNALPVEENQQQESSSGEEKWHDELMKPRPGAVACNDAAARVISRASEPQLAQLGSLDTTHTTHNDVVERWKYRVGQSQVFLAAGMFGMNNVLRVVPHIGSGRASAAMLQTPEGDLLTNCDAVMQLAVPGTDGEFLEVQCGIDTTASEADYARVMVKIRASSRAMADRFDVSDTQPYFVYWSNPQLEEGERDDEELPPTLCRTQSLLELARTFGIPPQSRPSADHQDGEHDGAHNDGDSGDEGLAHQVAALLVVCACAPAAPLSFFSDASIAVVHPVVVAVAKAFGGEEHDDEAEEGEEEQ